MLGATVPTRGGIHTAFKRGDRWNCEVVQFYLTLSRQWKVNDLSEEDKMKFQKAWAKSEVKEVIAHIPYLVNFTSQDESTREKSIERMIAEIKRAKWLGVQYLVLHPGSPGEQSKKKGITLLRKGFEKVFDQVNPGEVNILIETMAGQGTALGSDFEELSQILTTLGGNFKICFDSAHVFEAGYNLKTEDGYQKTFQKFQKYISLGQIFAFHLNDSKTEFNSAKDRHAHIGEGEIGLKFFELLLNDERFQDIPKVLETPEVETMNQENLRTLRNLKN